MKQFIFLISFLILTFNLIGQEWMNNLPQKDKSEYTLFDYQNAFSEYWDKYNVVNGKYTDDEGNIQKAYGWKQFKRWEYYWETRVDQKTGKFLKEEKHRAYKEYLKQISENSKDAAWVSLGPNSSGGGYAGIGRLNTIAFHPDDTDTFWVGAPAGGLWVTLTGGNDWSPLTENIEVQGVSAIIIPGDFEVSSTIYIGTGDRDAFDNKSIGVLKSTNAGQTWNTTGLSFNPADGEVVNNMLIHPFDDNVLYAATTAGMYKTIDAGVNWTLLTNNEFVDIEFHPSNPAMIYGSSRNGKIYRTSDNGVNWNQIFQSVSERRIELAVSDNAPDRLYILASNTSNGLEGIYRSDDYGENIELIFNSLALLNWSTDGSGTNNGQGWYDLSFAADPNEADVLYCGGVNTWKSVDGGYNWNLSNHWYGGGGVQAVHADKHYFKFRPGTSTFFECNDGGIYNTDDGILWNDLSNSLVISQIYGLSTAQTTSDVTIIGLQDNGTKLRNDNNWSDVLGGDGMKCIVDHEVDATQYGSLYFGAIHRTTNYWSNSTEISNNIPGGAAGAWVTPYVLDPNNSNILYVGYSTLWKSTDKGDSFESLGNFGSLRTVTVSESNSEIICISTNTYILKTTDGGINWNSINNNLPVANSPITDIEIKHDDPNTIWVSLGSYNSDGVYQTVDGGENWENISSGLLDISVNTIIQNKFESNEIQLYAGTDFGVYIKNGNSDWVLYGTDFPKVDVSELDIYYDNEAPENSRLRVSTYGRGLWEVPLELSGNFAPYISTVEVNNITENGAVGTGFINNDYGEPVIESGFIVSENINPNLQSPGVMIFQTNPLVTTGEFSVDIIGLSFGTKYYCKAYAVNANGIGYGNELTFNTECSVISILPFIQGFEDNGETPLCWSEEILTGSLKWNFGNSSNFDPYEGNYCAYLKGINSSGEKTLLILPEFNFIGQNKVGLSFWHIQPPFINFQDELKIMFKADISDNWTALEYYSDEVSDWTLREINLPDLSETYYIAFEGNAKFGMGIGIDNVSVDIISGIADINISDIRIIPNPSDGLIRIDGLTEDSFYLNVYNSLGELIFSDIHSKNTIDLTFLPKGIYFLKLNLSNKIITEKILIK